MEWVSQGYVFYHGEAYPSMNKKCIIIGAGINITPARLALINTDVNDGDYVILVGVSSDALNALAEFARQVYQDLNIDVKPITIDTQVSLVDAVSMLRSMIEGNAPCDEQVKKYVHMRQAAYDLAHMARNGMVSAVHSIPIGNTSPRCHKVFKL